MSASLFPFAVDVDVGHQKKKRKKKTAAKRKMTGVKGGRTSGRAATVMKSYTGICIAIPQMAILSGERGGGGRKQSSVVHRRCLLEQYRTVRNRCLG
jgi:hypothetical protein